MSKLSGKVIYEHINKAQIKHKKKNLNISTLLSMEERRVSFASASRKPLLRDGNRPTSPSPSDVPRQNGSVSGPGGKNKKSTDKKRSQSPKGSFNAGTRRDSRKGSLKSKEVKKVQEAATSSRGRSDSLFKKSDIRYKEIKRSLQKRQRDQKKQSESGEKQRQEL